MPQSLRALCLVLLAAPLLLGGEGRSRAAKTHARRKPGGPVVIMRIGRVKIYRQQSRIYFKSGLQIDVDGAPTAYHPNDEEALDTVKNAMKNPRANRPRWVGVVTDTGRPSGTPLLQGPDDPAPGYYISKTAYEVPGFADTDPRHYLDATRINYVVVPMKLAARFKTLNLLGSRARITNLETGAVCEGLVGDLGPNHKIGEASLAFARALQCGACSARFGIDRRIFLYEVFPGEPAKGFGLEEAPPEDASSVATP